MTATAPEPRTRTRALIILGVVAALLLGAFFLLTMSGDDDEPITLPTRRPTTTARPTATAEPSEAPPATGGGIGGRDPFEPVVLLGGDGNGNGNGDGNGNGNDDGGAIDGGNGDTKIIRLLDVFRQDGELLAIVEVDGREYTVAEGETFDGNVRLIDLARRCGSFVFGDERFTLCIGQEVQK